MRLFTPNNIRCGSPSHLKPNQFDGLSVYVCVYAFKLVELSRRLKLLCFEAVYVDGLHGLGDVSLTAYSGSLVICFHISINGQCSGGDGDCIKHFRSRHMSI